MKRAQRVKYVSAFNGSSLAPCSVLFLDIHCALAEVSASLI